jgi:hypothetical protein
VTDTSQRSNLPIPDRTYVGLTTFDARDPDTHIPPIQQVPKDYATHESEFTGKVHWVQIDLGKDDQDHLISPEERLHLAGPPVGSLGTDSPSRAAGPW